VEGRHDLGGLRSLAPVGCEADSPLRRERGGDPIRMGRHRNTKFGSIGYNIVLIGFGGAEGPGALQVPVKALMGGMDLEGHPSQP
jgi:hypothetical protein